MTGDLQFDRLEPARPAGQGASCEACRKPFGEAYFVAQDRRFCQSCRSAYEAHLNRSLSAAELAGAILAGLAAAVLADGANVLAGGQIGTTLIALLGGFFVGIAVRKGSGNRGGIACQAIAVALTYLAIVGSFIPALQKMALRPQGILPVDYLSILVAPVIPSARSVWRIFLVGFALYEAWGINRAPRLRFHGPFPTGSEPGKITGG
jgi:hypothetical protein